MGTEDIDYTDNPFADLEEVDEEWEDNGDVAEASHDSRIAFADPIVIEIN